MLRRPLHCGMVPNIWPDVRMASMQAGSTWQLALKKGHRLVNRTGQTLQMLHRCPFGLQACAAGLTADMITIEPEEVSILSSADISRQLTSHISRKQLQRIRM